MRIHTLFLGHLNLPILCKTEIPIKIQCFVPITDADRNYNKVIVLQSYNTANCSLELYSDKDTKIY